MENLSKRKSVVLDAIDEQITELEAKLAKVQPLINELNELRQVRRALLNQRGVTGGSGRGLTQEEVIQFFKSHSNEPSTAAEIAEEVGATPAAVRTHLNRYRDSTYTKDADNRWVLVNYEEDEE